MRRLSFAIALLLASPVLMGQSPHGNGFKTNCSDCHSTEGWKISKSQVLAFNHDTTRFTLTGQHQAVECRSCHKTLEFSTVGNECKDCHLDLHENTVGPDCARCHTPKTWIVANISQIHQQSRFPLTGAHQISDCAACHKSVSRFRFDPQGIACIDCHRADYQATTKPNHLEAGYSTNCTECHSASAGSWIGADFEHSFFPLSGGHAIDCKECHLDGQYTKISTDCFSCHEKDYQSSAKIEHQALGLPTDCLECHTTDPGWAPAKFTLHDTRFFPVYSGQHRGEWNTCTDCHRQEADYSTFSCIDCHEHNKTSMDNEHDEEKDYVYNSAACFACHPTGDKEGSFKHDLTTFPLTGKHQGADCLSCHKNGFAGTSSDCNTCHEKEFIDSKTPGHQAAGIPTDCKNCHGTDGWKPSTFSHLATGYELTGGHARIEQCSACHLGSIVTARQECISCHQVQYDNARDHKQNLYPIECIQCHSTENWQELSFNHGLTKFPLTGAHVTTECAKCHKLGYTGTSGECNSCHAANYAGVQVPNHAAAGISVQCETCHTTSAWKPSSFNHLTTGFELSGGHARVVQCSDCHKGTTQDANNQCIACHQVQYDNAKDHKSKIFPLDCKLCHTLNSWQGTSFNHSATRFPLTGAHSTTECAKCHQVGYAGTSTECNSCHAPNYAGAQVPNHAAAGLSIQCEDCHTAVAWKPSGFNHTTTGFELAGGHARIIQCSDCHKGTTVNTPDQCITCHKVQYDNAKDHKALSFPGECGLCHNMNTWENAVFDHSKTKFPLSGVHMTTECAQCHKSGYSGTSAECNSCHAPDYTGAQTPNHTTAGIPVQCENCHTANSWKPSTFNHTTTGYQLTGGHSMVVQCSDCHKGTTQNTPTQCISCHQVQYDNAKDHKTQSYPVDCGMCHNNNNWQGATFNHSQTNFPLLGAHLTTTCSKCHANGFTNTPTQCNSCHSENYNGSQVPSHTAAGISVLCETCHNATAWKPSTFNHTTTGYQLTGGHSLVVQCSDCHRGTTQNTPTQCINCHQIQYDNAKDHKTQSYPVECSMCHNNNNWLGATFNHSQTNFPLLGAHLTTTCSKCHANGFTNTPTQCNSCHSANYTESQVPSHTAAGISVLCETCHNATAWKPSTFNHTTTGYQLTGGHSLVVQCSDCHRGTTQNTPTECISCHQVQYDNAKDHKTQSYPIDCSMCHNNNNWQGATFNHSQTNFPLTGAHLTTTCSKCHTTGFTNTPTDCASCHLTNYNQATNPNHAAANFPKDCAPCHSTTAWTPSTFNHDAQYFPIYSGEHQGEWSLCSDCHTTANNYALFSCIDCHEHNKTDMDKEHRDERDYVYNSVACYTCHPRGKSELKRPI